MTREEKRALKDRVQAEELQRVREAENCAPPTSPTAATDVATVEGEVKRGRGRPSEYTEEEGDAICAWVAEGKSLRSYSRVTGRDLTTIYRWLRERGDFHKRYARAHDDRADTLADELVDIADEVAGGTLEEIQAARLRIDTRKWISAKLRPTKWGETPVPQQKTNVVFNIGLKPAQLRTVDHTVGTTIDAEPLPVLEQTADNVSAH
jgi:hypothetical protein